MTLTFVRNTHALKWPHFSAAEMACRHCGEGYVWPEFMDALEALRADLGRPVIILSAHRCALHNARIGGAPLSQHLRLAVDIATHNHNRGELLRAAKTTGFTGFGFYAQFLHLDMGRERQWFGNSKGRDIWQPYLT